MATQQQEVAMSRPVEFTKEEITASEKVINETKGNDQLFEALTVRLSAVAGCTVEQVAEILGKSKVTVSRMRKRFRECVKSADSPVSRKGRGGRRRELLSPEEEKEFLQPWIEKARQGGILVVPPIHRALEKRVGREVATATTYNMLARHGWRKVKPDTKHPKSDEAAQEAFKKTSQMSLPKRSLWLPRKA